MIQNRKIKKSKKKIKNKNKNKINKKKIITKGGSKKKRK